MKKIFYALIAIFTFSFPAFVFAATLSIRVQPSVVGVGQTLQVTIFLNSVTPVNAFSGTLRFPTDTLTPTAVSDGNSIVSAWITHPTIGGTGDITFAGVTPGGFSGKGGALFSALFKTTAATYAHIMLTDVRVLRNDGKGTSEPVTLIPADVTVTSASQATFTEPSDTAPPEPFTLYLGNSPQLFNGRYYLVFAAVDKGSGVDHYEVAETRWPEWLIAPVWTRTDSPYLIRDQYLTSDVLIKAVDRAGNERISIFPRQNFLRAREWLIACGILALFVGVLWYRRRPGT
ncbi:cohesin domain-containing protein [Patescibacteria group bacterium]|nr:cohesin domain-containing protein [Patescibacteria group bacterium]MDE2173201.1 hypothetical protein [Patescibacteria group bacterium]